MWMQNNHSSRVVERFVPLLSSCLVFFIFSIFVSASPQPVKYKISTLAGIGTPGYSGNYGHALSAQLNEPYSLALSNDSQYLFVVEHENHVLRKIDLNSQFIIPVCNENAQPGYNGGEMDPLQNLLNEPTGIAISKVNGDIFISDSENHVIKRISILDQLIHVVAGNTTAGYNGEELNATNSMMNEPAGLYVNSNGEILVVDSENHILRVLKFNESYYTMELVAGVPNEAGFNGDGLVLMSKLNEPIGVTQDGNGNVYISDTENHMIRKISGNTLMTIAGTGVAGFSNDTCQNATLDCPLNEPTSLVFSPLNGDLIFVDKKNNKVRKLSPEGSLVTIAGDGIASFSGENDTDSLLASLNEPNGVAIDENGTIYIADTMNHRVRKLSPYCENGYMLRENQTACDMTCFGILENSSQVCQSRGWCVSVNLCECFNTSQYGGENCQFTKCNGILSNETQQVCHGHGDCISPDNCQCHEGYFGAFCEITQCHGILSNDSNVCNGKGNCVDLNVCHCTDSKFGGANCDIAICHGILANDSSVCSSHGACLNGTCECSGGWFGELCEIPSCNGTLANETVVCSGHGTCQDINQCICHENYNGENCQYPYCNGILSNATSSVCSSHGQCISPNECSCFEYWYGPYCNVTSCFGEFSNSSHVCNDGKGTCVDFNTCECQQNSTPYFGDQCQFTTCFGIFSNDTSNVCNNHGNCTSFNVCECFEGYIGENCSIPTCFGIPANETKYVCDRIGYCVEKDHCVNYTCNGTLSSDPLSCSSHGLCIGNDHCECQEFYFGSNCEFSSQIPTCYGILANDSRVCNDRNGSCVSLDRCECHLGYSGKECEIPICYQKLSNDSNVCSNHGNCISPNQCQCQEGYLGLQCEIPVCYGIAANDSAVCNFGKGQCVSYNNCSCFNSQEWTGQDCSVPVCYGKTLSQACSGRGNCLHNHTCSCPSKYEGTECEFHKCFNVLNTSSSVCSGKGKCVNDDTCQCYENEKYFGQNCEFTSCYGVASSNASLVCNYGNGTCVDFNSCQCNENSLYGGPQCSDPKCFGILSTQYSKVCHGNGNCTNVDKCSCFSGFLGDECDLLTLSKISLQFNATKGLYSQTLIQLTINDELLNLYYSNRSILGKFTFELSVGDAGRYVLLSTNTTFKEIPLSNSKLEFFIPSSLYSNLNDHTNNNTILTASVELFDSRTMTKISNKVSSSNSFIYENPNIDKQVSNQENNNGVSGGVIALAVVIPIASLAGIAVIVGTIAGAVMYYKKKMAATNAMGLMKAQNEDFELAQGF
ncbi:hypothetical protein C9374_010972 [Naegleria lovaniensis]|uniref:EGF-like domain-containing protein n=1 Tax=Naegleria lovaniensis TaxID=51637 RepID=A0AA88GB01_NAELO|nr:uncharacterized protein C9374_010972 [Naegleria lovaniensis]KAG2374402.1 hypothetical protein C9374_010972 [Naegleria lovaniensis]